MKRALVVAACVFGSLPANAAPPRREAFKVVAAYSPSKVTDVAFKGLALDGAVGFTYGAGPHFVDVFAGLGYERAVAQSGLLLSKYLLRANVQYRMPYVAFGIGARSGYLALESTVSRRGNGTFGLEATASVEPIRFADHAILIEARAFADFTGVAFLGVSLGAGFRF